jgi:hypothetical protein
VRRGGVGEAELDALARVHAANRIREVDGVDRLRDVAVGAACERVVRALRLVRGREHDDAHVAAGLPDPVDTCEPVHLRHVQVEQADVGLVLVQQRQHLTPPPRLRDDLDVVGGREHAAERAQDQPVVVRNQQPDRHSNSPLPDERRCRSASDRIVHPSCNRVNGPHDEPSVGPDPRTGTAAV